MRAYLRARMPSDAMRWLRQAEAARISLPDLAMKVASLSDELSFSGDVHAKLRSTSLRKGTVSFAS